MQESQQPDKLKVGEALYLYASFYPRAADPEGLLVALGLADKRSTPFAKLSGGQAVLAVQSAACHRRRLPREGHPAADVDDTRAAAGAAFGRCRGQRLGGCVRDRRSRDRREAGLRREPPDTGFGFVLVLVLTAATVLALVALVASCRALCGT